VAIVGASAAGFAVADTLRGEGFSGPITVIGEEPHAFYDRPPLSKSLIARDADMNVLSLCRGQPLDRLGLDIRLGVRATRLHLADRRIDLDDGTAVTFDKLVLATGVTPVSLPGVGLTLRTLDDAVRIGEALNSAGRVVVVGGGVLGCELAALASQQGKRTVLIDPLGGPMIDRVGPRVASRLARLHAAHGVEMILGTTVTEIATLPGGEQSIRLGGGRTLRADIVLVAIGSRPATRWLAGSGITLGDGILCDEHCEAAAGVFAAGDVANWHNPRFARRMRIEHRMNATEQGMAVAANILGRNEVFAPIPYFWTDQYDTRIQVHGLIGGKLETVVLTGDTSEGGFVLAYVRDRVVEGILGWNMPRETLKSRAMVGKPLP
jgi:NADPH-dependent 2,4-dienoyl-CoA reductase/sulfur reductase-like enzyme